MKLRGGYLCVLGLWFLVPLDVAASLVPAVVAAAASATTLQRPFCQLLRAA